DGGKFILLDSGAFLEAACRLKIRYLPAQVSTLSRSLKIEAKMLVNDWKSSLVQQFERMFPRAVTFSESPKLTEDCRNFTAVSLAAEGCPELYGYFRKGKSGCLSGQIFTFFDFLGEKCTFSRYYYPGRLSGKTIKQANNGCRLEVVHLNHNDLLFAVNQKYRFPACLLKFEAGCRILGINYPVSVLNENVSIREKKQFLHELISLRLNMGQSEFIKSGVYILNY
ncbi:MAG: hypothetical protein JSV44_06380, partial [Candidatus Zixiibacteriota bacterium]